MLSHPPALVHLHPSVVMWGASNHGILVMSFLDTASRSTQAICTIRSSIKPGKVPIGCQKRACSTSAHAAQRRLTHDSSDQMLTTLAALHRVPAQGSTQFVQPPRIAQTDGANGHSFLSSIGQGWWRKLRHRSGQPVRRGMAEADELFTVAVQDGGSQCLDGNHVQLPSWRCVI